MPHIDPHQFAPVASRLLGRVHLTPAEQAEVLRMAQGFVCKDSAAAAKVSPETIRARRKRIYRKLHLRGVSHLVSGLLAVSLEMLASRERLAPEATAGNDASAPAVGLGVGTNRNTAVPGLLAGSSRLDGSTTSATPAPWSAPGTT